MIWEVKRNDGGARDSFLKYYWFNSPYSSFTMEFYIQAVNEENLCGASDWYLPSIDTLKGLVDLNFYPTINTNYFPYTKKAYYWSATPSDNISEGAWAVGFSYGDSGNGQKDGGTLHVRLVRQAN